MKDSADRLEKEAVWLAEAAVRFEEVVLERLVKDTVSLMAMADKEDPVLQVYDREGLDPLVIAVDMMGVHTLAGHWEVVDMADSLVLVLVCKVGKQVQAPAVDRWADQLQAFDMMDIVELVLDTDKLG